MKIYLTNNATVAAVVRGDASEISRRAVGPGPVLSIMRWPRVEQGEGGQGRVLALTPPQRYAAPALEAKRQFDAGSPEAAEEWARYEAGLRALWKDWTGDMLGPGRLSYGEEATQGDPSASRWDGSYWHRLGTVPDGATLTCACSRAAAAAGRCHRVIAASLLLPLGWEVILDGAPYQIGGRS